MESKYSSKASLFLMELIIAVLFFAISSAICTQMFVKSHLISQQTVNENHTVLWVQNISESFYSKSGNFSDTKSLFIDRQSNINLPQFTTLFSNYEEYLYITFDKNWNVTVNDTDARYLIVALYHADDTFHYIDFISCQLPGNAEDTSSVYMNAVDSSSFCELLSNQQIWNYSLQIKTYSGMKGEQHE